MSTRGFRQVDVFTAVATLGNPVAVVHDAEGLSDEQMQAFARWTNLSETTFLLAPEHPDAHYRLRIFTPARELPFAGHPTLGSAHAWLEAGGRAGADGTVVQECGVGLVRLRATDGRLAFAAPPLIREGAVEPGTAAQVVAGLGIDAADVLEMAWADNGPGWVGVRLASAEQVLALTPSIRDLPVDVGVIGPHADDAECDVEVRAFVPHAAGIGEDPVTGSLNASLAQWLAGRVLPSSYVAAQGTVLGRRGRVHIDTDDDGVIWVGGDTLSTVVGTVTL
ncbi:PhzF family phenazine biosynthesis protein [Nocardioides sp.]|uniref:PhzF family phenazine biosynthesis protein n=1 Tax=Nocardioides sp. TaxID=35761 RepID=UPI00351389E6